MAHFRTSSQRSHAFLKILAQTRPSGTSAVSVYSPNSGDKAIIKQIIICNTTGSAAAFSIYLDEDGTTYNETTALYFAHNINANDTIPIVFAEEEGWLPMNDAAGNLAVQTDTGSALTFTIIGEEY